MFVFLFLHEKIGLVLQSKIFFNFYFQFFSDIYLYTFFISVFYSFDNFIGWEKRFKISWIFRDFLKAAWNPLLLFN